MRKAMFVMLFTLSWILGNTNASQPTPAPVHSAWVFPGKDGRLNYRQAEDGARIIDFSTAGYMGGGVALPRVPVKRTLTPGGVDDTEAIRKALEEIAILPVDGNGFRGALQLSPGVFYVSQTLSLPASGIVLSGSGSSGAAMTKLCAIGDPRKILVINGKDAAEMTGIPHRIADTRLSVGSTALNMVDVAGLSVGDDILVNHYRGSNWIADMGMDALVKNGKPLTWLGAGYHAFDRKVAGIKGNVVTLDAPLPDFIDERYAGGISNFISAYTWPGRIRRCGFSRMTVEARFIPGDITAKLFQGVLVEKAEDCFIDDMKFIDCGAGSAVVDRYAKRVTVRNIEFSRSQNQAGDAGGSADVTLIGSQILVLGGRSTTSCFIIVTQRQTYGPNVVHGFRGLGSGPIQPHARWATALLVDQCTLAGGIEILNRGIMGSGHGWTMGYGVIWNCAADRYWFEKPPLAQNWCIGSTGTIGYYKKNDKPQGIFESHGTNVTPDSLYLAQLRDRLGDQAVARIFE